jgi:hypothetical protein
VGIAPAISKAMRRAGNRCLAFSAFHPPGISTAFRGLALEHGDQTLSFAILPI